MVVEKQIQIPDLNRLVTTWGAPFVSRKQVAKFSGGLLNPRTLANYDCKGEGPRERFRVGRDVAYPVDALIEWLEKRISACATHGHNINPKDLKNPER